MPFSLGIRCSNDDFSYVILKGSKQEPAIVCSDSIKFPAGFARPNSLNWFLQEIITIVDCHSNEIKSVTIKCPEGSVKRSKSNDHRIENEAIVQLAANTKAIKNVSKKVKSTIAKDLGFKGQAKYLETINFSIFPGFRTNNIPLKEALLAAWSSL